METKDEGRRGVWLELHPGKTEEKVFTEMFNCLCFLFYQWLEVYVNWQLSTKLSKNSASWDHCTDNTLLFTLLVLSPNIIPLPHTLSSPELGGLNTSFLPWKDRAVSSALGEMAAVPWCHSDALALTDWRTKRWAGGKPWLTGELRDGQEGRKETNPFLVQGHLRCVPTENFSFQEHQNYFQVLYSSRAVHKHPSWLPRAPRRWEAWSVRVSLHLLSPCEDAEMSFPARVPRAWLRLSEFSTALSLAIAFFKSCTRSRFFISACRSWEGLCCVWFLLQCGAGPGGSRHS